MKGALSLGEFEKLVLMAVARLGNNAYGVTIRQTAEEFSRRSVSIGAVYATLDRLADKGYVKSRAGEATPERGGRAKKYFELEGLGQQALIESERIQREMLSGVELGALVGGVA